jgi:hypothetical protein
MFMMYCCLFKMQAKKNVYKQSPCYYTLTSTVQYVSNLTRPMKNDIEKNLHIKVGIDNFITLLNTYFQARIIKSCNPVKLQQHKQKEIQFISVLPFEIQTFQTSSTWKKYSCWYIVAAKWFTSLAVLFLHYCRFTRIVIHIVAHNAAWKTDKISSSFVWQAVLLHSLQDLHTYQEEGIKAGQQAASTSTNMFHSLKYK